MHGELSLLVLCTYTRQVGRAEAATNEPPPLHTHSPTPIPPRHMRDEPFVYVYLCVFLYVHRRHVKYEYEHAPKPPLSLYDQYCRCVTVESYCNNNLSLEKRAALRTPYTTPCYRTTYHPGRILHYPRIMWEGIGEGGKEGVGAKGSVVVAYKRLPSRLYIVGILLYISDTITAVVLYHRHSRFSTQREAGRSGISFRNTNKI